MTKRALIVWGGWPGHAPELGAKMVAGMLASEGWATDLSDDFADLGRAAEYDLVIPNVTGEEIDKTVARALSAAVRGGTGLAGFHGCIATSFPASVDFGYLAAVRFVGHPGNIIDYRVNITRPHDPLVEGIADFDYRSEQYYLHYDPTVEILATTTFSGEHDPVTRNVTMPVVIKRQFSAGRIFWSALGHTPDEFRHAPMREILRRGLLWAAR
jgi:type 1 glutamine amidotransferase